MGDEQRAGTSLEVVGGTGVSAEGLAVNERA
jgi:hypothetical protein